MKGNAPPKGNLSYKDHGVDVRIKARSYGSLVIESGACGPGTHAAFSGTADVTRQGVTTSQSFQVEVDDCGEPGSLDTFSILTAGYANSGTLIGGNIQIH